MSVHKASNRTSGASTLERPIARRCFHTRNRKCRLKMASPADLSTFPFMRLAGVLFTQSMEQPDHKTTKPSNLGVASLPPRRQVRLGRRPLLRRQDTPMPMLPVSNFAIIGNWDWQLATFSHWQHFMPQGSFPHGSIRRCSRATGRTDRN